MIIAETERLILRRLELSDANDLFRIYSDRDMLQYLGGGPLTRDEERRKLERHICDYYEVQGFGLWGIVLKDTGSLIGRCGILFSEINGKKAPELAYLVDRSWWGKGVATEASFAVLDVAANQFGFSRIVAIIHPDNAGSIRVIEKLGFEYETRIASYKDFGSVLLYGSCLPPGPANEASGSSI